MKSKKYCTPTATQEIAWFYMGAVMAAAAAFVNPDIFNYADTQGSNDLKLSLQITGIMLQGISALMLALRIFRGPDVEQAIQDHQRLNELLSQEFKKNLKEKTLEANFKIIEITETKIELEKFYSTAYSFGKTERQVAIAGLLLFALGAHLQLISAG
jgi:hypothetical protein